MDLMTVTGPVAKDSLGVVLPHEHLFIDLRNQFTEFDDPEKRALSRLPVCMRHLGTLRANPYAMKDNLLLDDVDTAVEEIGLFQKSGGRTVVDCTSVGIKRDPVKLREVAKRTGLNIVAGSGYYTYDTHPADLESKWPVERIADEMLRDVLEGIDGTGVRAGIYGEVGTSDPIRPGEKKALLGAAKAFNKHRAEIQVHTFPWGNAGVEASRILIDNGVDPAKIVICHIDVQFRKDYLLQLLKLGVNIEFDDFGKEFYIPKSDKGFAGGPFARDIERVRMIGELLNRDYESQILITTDVCLKNLLRTYGGFGYDHILTNIVPMMRDEGISQRSIDNILTRNPALVLCD